MKLTREQAIIEHRKMWNWIADEIEKVKIPLNIYMIKAKYCDMNGFRDIDNNCFLCEFVKQINKFGTCKILCPLVWSKSGGCIPPAKTGNGIYERVVKTDSWQEQAALSRQIANLPERTDV